MQKSNLNPSVLGQSQGALKFFGSQSIGARAQAALDSPFVRNAMMLVFLNTLAKLLMFAGNVYAARCLGPVNLGVSAQILAVGQQAAIVYNGGFDPIAVREIADDRDRLPRITRVVVLFRVLAATILLLGWTLLVLNRYDDSPLRTAWLLGGLVMFLGSLNINFIFQGLEKLPIQSAAGVLTAALTAGAYFLFFRRGMPLGSDLIVAIIASVIPLCGLWAYYFLKINAQGIRDVGFSEMALTIQGLVKESWHYWVLAGVIFLYSGIQIPIVTHYLGERNAGIYRTAMLFSNGLYLIYMSINSLLLPRFVAWRKHGVQEMWSRQKKLVLISSLIGVPMTVLTIGVAPWIYSKFLGSEFADGERVFQVLALQMLIVFVGQIFAWGLTANGQHSAFLIASLLGAIVCISGNPFVAPAFGLIGVALVSLTSEIVVHGYCYFAAAVHVHKIKIVE